MVPGTCAPPFAFLGGSLETFVRQYSDMRSAVKWPAGVKGNFSVLGVGALAHASQQAASRLEHDDFQAFGLWKRIAHAIVQIRKAERHGEH